MSNGPTPPIDVEDAIRTAVNGLVEAGEALENLDNRLTTTERQIGWVARFAIVVQDTYARLTGRVTSVSDRVETLETNAQQVTTRLDRIERSQSPTVPWGLALAAAAIAGLAGWIIAGIVIGRPVTRTEMVGNVLINTFQGPTLSAGGQLVAKFATAIGFAAAAAGLVCVFGRRSSETTTSSVASAAVASSTSQTVIAEETRSSGNGVGQPAPAPDTGPAANPAEPNPTPTPARV